MSGHNSTTYGKKIRCDDLRALTSDCFGPKTKRGGISTTKKKVNRDGLFPYTGARTDGSNKVQISNYVSSKYNFMGHPAAEEGRDTNI